MIEIRSSTSAPGGSIGNGDGNGSGFAFACGFAQWAPPSQGAVTSAGGWVPYHLSPITSRKRARRRARKAGEGTAP